MSYLDHVPPKVRRRSRTKDEPIGHKCDECERRDAPSLIEFHVVTAGSEDNYDRTHRVCRACLEKSLAMLSDPAFVQTRTVTSGEEDLARVFATSVHADQKYDSGTEPYVVHLAEVRDVLVEFGWSYNSDLLVSAWLHDVLEDTAVKSDEIHLKFGERVVRLVWAVTGVGGSRKARNEDAYGKMTSYPESIPLKLADRIANARASKQTSPDRLFEMYRGEYPGFRERLKPHSETDARSERMWAELDALLGKDAR
jgi:hypothetical protein